MGLFDFLKKKFETVSHQVASELSTTGAFLIDVREPNEFRTGHAPGAKNISVSVLGSKLGLVPIEREILVICQSGMRSSQAAGLLAKNGYNVKNVAGGMAGWRRAGLKVSK